MAVVWKVHPITVAKDAAIKIVAWLGATGVLSGNVAVRMSKNGGASSPVAFSLSEIGDEQYLITVASGLNDTAGLANLFVSGVNGQTAIDLIIEDGAKTPGELAADLNSGATVVVAKDASITAAKFGTDAVDANALAADAVAEITNSVWAPGNVQAIWDVLTSALTTAGSIGKLLVDNVDEALSTIDTVVDAIKAKTDQLNFTGANVNSDPQTDVTVAAASQAAIVDALCDETLTAHNVADSLARALKYCRGFAVGKIEVTGTIPNLTLKLYDENGTTLLGTHTVTTDASGNVTERSERS